MATPVVTVASGGLPVTDVTSTSARGLPITEAANGRGTAVTKVAAGGRPVVYSGVVDFPPPFTPLSLPGLIGWWDPSVTASLTLSGATITAMAEQSGAGNTLTGSGPATYDATGFNGIPAVRLNNGSPGYLFKNPFAMGAGNTLTAWYLGTTASGATSSSGRTMSYDGAGHDYDNAGSWTVANSVSLNNTFLTRNNISTGQNGLSAYPAGHRFIYTIDASGVITVYVDGVASTTVTSPGNWVSGGSLVFGVQANAGSDGWAGLMADWGIATGLASAANIARLDLYLKNKGRL